MADPRIRSLGDTVVLLEFEPVIDPRVNARVLAIARALERLHLEGVRDVVPTYAAVAAHLDPLVTDTAAVAERMAALAATVVEAPDAAETKETIIPVRYGGVDGPDLPALAAWAGISEEEVVARHAQRTYRVFMVGFLPGFPYMGVVDETIAMPRLDTPRARVAAGSVGIAGSQTGIYPLETPGGWRVIGRAEYTLFDFRREPPALLAPGQRVRFVPAVVSPAGSSVAGGG